ncbi:endonuclease VIII, partial [candidate division KSB1 bacterium]|nr:endonuclease VIII [candidate division KSB1 bacterium]
SAVTQMWGAMELYAKGEELERPYVKGMRPTPVDDAFTFPYFEELIDERVSSGKQSVKGLLTQEQLIPGLGNSIAQDIMFNAKLHPKRSIDDLIGSEKKQLYDAIIKTVSRVIELGGRNDEYNLFGQPGGYRRILDKNAAGKPCPSCSTTIVKIQYLGGACYYCPSCQV